MSGLKHLRFTDFPGSYFEANRLTVNHANDTLCDEAFINEAKPIVSLLDRVHRHPLMRVALKRAISERYTYSRIKSYVLLREFSQRHSSVVFWVRDHRNVTDLFTENFKKKGMGTIIEVGGWMCGWRSFLGYTGVVFYLLAALFYLIIRRPFCLKAPPPQPWKVGFDLFNCGIHWNFPHFDELIYDDQELLPSKILHVVRKQLYDEKSRKYFSDHKISFVEAGILPLPMSYLFGRIIPIFMGKILVALWQTRGNPRALPFMGEGVRLLMAVLVRAELLDAQFPTDVFVGRDEGVAHIVHTMLHDKRGGRTIGFTHGDVLCPEVPISNLAWHTFCVGGDFTKALLAGHTQHCHHVAVIGAGVYGLDYSFRNRHHPLPGTFPYNAFKKKGKLVGVFGTNVSENDFVSETMRRRFYSKTVEIIKPYQDVVAVLRPKAGGVDDLSWPRRMAQRNDRVLVDISTWTYDALPWFDLVVCMGISTVGIEALMAGVPVFFFDETGLPDHPYEKSSPILVARTPKGLQKRVEDFLTRGIYVDKKIVESIRQRHGGYYDGKTRERLRSEVYRMISETKRSPVQV